MLYFLHERWRSLHNIANAHNEAWGSTDINVIIECYVSEELLLTNMGNKPTTSVTKTPKNQEPKFEGYLIGPELGNI